MTCSLENVTALQRGPFFLMTDMGSLDLDNRGVSLDLKLVEDVRTTFSVRSLIIKLTVKRGFAPVRLTSFFHNQDIVFKVSVTHVNRIIMHLYTIVAKAYKNPFQQKRWTNQSNQQYFHSPYL